MQFKNNLNTAADKIKSIKESYQKMLESVSDAIYIVDTDLRIIFINQVLKKCCIDLLGLNIDIIGKDVLTAFPFLNENILNEYRQVINTGEILITKETLKINNNKISIETRKLPLVEEGKIPCVVTVLRDISDYKRQKSSLQQSNNIYRPIFENTGTATIVIDENSVISKANEAFETLSGYSREDVEGKISWTEFIEEDITVIREHDGFRTKQMFALPEKSEFRLVDQHGNLKHVSITSNKITGTTKTILSFHDISERKKTENLLRINEIRYRSIVELQPEAVCRWLPDTTLTFVNSGYCNFFGKNRQELLGQKWLMLIPDRSREEVKSFCKYLTNNPNARIYDHEVIGSDGQIRWQQWTDAPIFNDEGCLIEFQSIGRDITERKHTEQERLKLEIQLRHAQRMEAMGTMAGGIAHNFNNLLMGIQGNVSLMLLKTDDTHPYYQRLETIENLVESGSRLTNELLRYAREGDFEIKPINLNKLVMESSDTFGLTKKEIKICLDLDQNLSVIMADQGQIEQILMNLYVNASDAMPNGGNLFLKTMNIKHLDIMARSFTPKPGNYVILSVRDTGTGIDKEIMDRIFEPFFTTKDISRATGLGLSSVYGIVKSHGGHIDVYSEKGLGATFNAYLPASEIEIPQEKDSSKNILKGHETILLIDDEDIIIDVGLQILQTLGYDVLTAKSGKEALRICNDKMNQIDMVILDMIMPDVSGGDTYDALKRINPGMKVLLSSGYGLEGKASEILNRGCDGFIQKPFDMNKLSQKIREVLTKPAISS